MRLKAPTLVESYEYIYSGDDALDSSVADFEKRHEEAMLSGDLAQLPIRQGQSAVVWKLRHLSGIPRRRLRDMMSADRRSGDVISWATVYHACRFALEGVDGLLNERNQPVTISHYPERESWGGEPCVTKECMEWLRCIECADKTVTNNSLVDELGSVALIRMAVQGNS